MSQEGEKYHFWKGGGGINIVFGPQYKPLAKPSPKHTVQIKKIA
jgi:hypothetical protein